MNENINANVCRKCLAVGIILLFVGTCIIPAIAQDIEKSSLPTSRGNWLYVGGSGPGNYTKIQDAINDSSAGDTVFVYDDSSPYYENVVINKSINLIGENQETTVIDGNGGFIVVFLTEMAFVEYVAVNGFTIQNGGIGIDYDTGINNINMQSLLLNRKYTSSAGFYNNTLINNEIGIEVGWGSENVFLYNNKITTNKKAIVLDNCYFDNDIYENTIVDNDYGICLYNSPVNYIIENSIISNKNDGIALSYSDSNTITRNTIINNTNGINLSNSDNNFIDYNQVRYNYFSVFLYYSHSNDINKNVITENTLGICLLESSRNDIQGNTLENNEYAISLVLFSEQNKIIGNTIKSNSIRGLSLDGYCDENIIHKNNFIKNDRHAYFSNSFQNSWDENYWDNWIGLKINLSIFQKFPKVIVGQTMITWINFDRHPAKEPYDVPVIS